MVNPSICLQEGRGLPVRLEQSILFDQTFSVDRPVLWVVDPRTGFWMPFWIEAEVRAVLLEAVAGKLALPAISEGMLDLLIQACVLVDPKSADCIRQGKLTLAGEDYIQEARQQISSCGYAVLRDLIHPIQSAALRTYYRQIDRAGQFRPGDTQAYNRLVLSSEPTACFVHQQLETLMNRILPEQVKASYCFLMAYKSGAFLPRHTDRQQCLWNVSLALDTEPELGRDQAWPLVLETSSGPRPIRLAVGDAVIYSGTTMPHWRDTLPQDQEATLCAFHFVSEDFRGDLN